MRIQNFERRWELGRGQRKQSIFTNSEKEPLPKRPTLDIFLISFSLWRGIKNPN